jgi:hypothetical protein
MRFMILFIVSPLRTAIVFWDINMYTQMLGVKSHLFSTCFGLNYPSSGSIMNHVTAKSYIHHPCYKSSPATRHWGAWGERRYSSYPFTTSALDRGEWSASRPGRGLPPRKGPPVPIVQEAGWAPEPVWTQRLEEKSFAPAGDRAPIAQSVARHCTDLATPAPTALLYELIIKWIVKFRLWYLI